MINIFRKISGTNLPYSANIQIGASTKVVTESIYELIHRNDERIYGMKNYTGQIYGDAFSVTDRRGNRKYRIIGTITDNQETTQIRLQANAHIPSLSIKFIIAIIACSAP